MLLTKTLTTRLSEKESKNILQETLRHVKRIGAAKRFIQKQNKAERQNLKSFLRQQTVVGAT
jgi:hypothetical protein